MSGLNGIEFGNRQVFGGGDASIRLRESRERLVEEAAEVSEGASTGETKTFGDVIRGMVKDANESQIHADLKMQDVAAGRSKDLHGAVLAMEKADVQFRMITQVRNKVIEAYREILRMQV